MTEEQQTLLTNLETRVRQLMLLCKSLREEKDALERASADKDIILKSTQQALSEMEARYNNLKLAGLVSFGKKDVKEAQQTLSSIVREIDKCIELINE
ncbi:MAG: hypothetical protein GX619_09645 [Bacteroidales bacterium]|jgi:hypothetical protein|nr:hypothetical protein [Bacteroidales bacterium]OPZ96155.1 MAG: hypothetical protein BWY72_01791 [Bacteroidetes bacterium ADurb.Bin416]HBL73255.1 hypothetical protein [Bacteroidales bacterium]